MKPFGWIVLGFGLLGWILWLAAMDAVQRDVSLERWIKERLTFDRGVPNE